MAKIFDQRKFVLLASQATADGGVQRSLTTVTWDVAGRCQRPVYREMSFRPRPVGMAPTEESVTSSSFGQGMEFDVPCRSCEHCLKARAANWRFKCQNELREATRSWFITLTFRPELQYRAKCGVHLRLLERSTTWEETSEDEKFRLTAGELGKEITRYLKRLRKAGARVRYCLVAEAHKSGLPHFHMLLHEVSEENPVRHKLLVDKWGCGFMNAKLTSNEPHVAYYVTKYLTKSARARIRASAEYGSNATLVHSDENHVMGFQNENHDLQGNKTSSPRF
jgi:hypothetical protein